VKDKAFLIFKKEKHPIHFNDVAKLINDVFLSDRRAHPQTVHNELIKDQRFVLVGRGTYALADWGYEPGTVRDVIVSILKNAKTGLTKNEIVKVKQRKEQLEDNIKEVNEKIKVIEAEQNAAKKEISSKNKDLEQINKKIDELRKKNNLDGAEDIEKKIL